MTYRLFYAPATASLCVHWMLVELGVPFEVELVDFDAGGQKSPEYLRLNPQGRVPSLVVDGEAYGESAALLMLLAERHPEAGFAPGPKDAGRARWLETMVYLTNNLSPPFRDWFYAGKDGHPAGAEAVQALARSKIEAVWERLDGMLGDGRSYLLGERLTTVDFLATMLMRWSRNMARPATSWPQIAGYVPRMRARPAFLEVCRREGITDWMNA
jgi:glutathione S-transferase